MKRMWILLVFLAVTAGLLNAQEGMPESAEARSARETAARIMAIEDDTAAGEALAEAIRQIVTDPERNESGEAELILAYILQTDSTRAMRIIPTAFRALVGQIPLAAFQRLAAAALAAAGPSAASALTQALLDALEGQSRWAAAVLFAAKDVQGALPPVLYQTLVQLSSVVLPPVVVPKQPPPPPPPPPPYKGQ